MWEAVPLRRIMTLDGHEESVMGVVAGHAGRRVFSIGRSGILKVWDARSGRLLQELHTPTGPVTGALAISRDDKYIAAGLCWRNGVCVWKRED